jgi:hypothetical protein
MANLSEAQIKELLEVPVNKIPIAQARKQHQRLQLHNIPYLDASEISPAYKDFILWVRSYLPKDKAATFEKLITFPLPSVSVTNEIFDGLKRALEGENGFVKWQFKNEELESDYAEYRAAIKEEAFWKTKGFEAYKSAINSILICDLPSEQKGEKPEPYFYLLDLSTVWDLQLNSEGEVEYIIFDEGDLTRFVYDSTFYRVYKRAEIDAPWVLITVNQHSFYNELGDLIDGLGYCPAKPFWDVALSSPNSLQRQNAITKLLGKLDRFNFWEVAIEFYETYGVFPIHWEYANTCDYKDERGFACEGGFIHGETFLDGTAVPLDRKECPKCATNYFGPGTVKSVEPPTDNTDADLREPAGIIKVDVEALKYVKDKHEARRAELVNWAAGKSIEPTNNQAQNEKQVKSSFEAKRDALVALKTSFENIRQWLNETMCILRYGRKQFITSTVLFGDEFYLVDEAELVLEYKDSKAAGLPQFYLAASREAIIQTRFRNNADLLLRAKILSYLEPFPDLTINELLGISAKNPEIVPPLALMLKCNFDSYIKRFETEELDVVRFGSKIEFNTKIKTILDKLYTYVKDDRAESISAQPDSGAASGNQV